MRRLNLRMQVALWLLAPLLGLLALDSWLTYQRAMSAAHHAFDRTLASSLKSIREGVRLDQGEVIVDLPYLALEMFESNDGGKIYYQIREDGGRNVTGYPDLPQPEANAEPFQPVFYDAPYRGEQLRMAALRLPVHDVPTAQTRLVRVLVGETIEARQALAAIAGQSSAALAEARRQEALAAMGDTAEQYIEAATASRLLRWAIDRYRDQKQGPMLSRAGEIFAGLTLGEFLRLTVDTERQPPELSARRASGRSVEVGGLSEGTRDQLFLALRIAALELQLAHKAALPFVADDLFINFDDARSKAGLEALRELSSRTQVLFLTHHDHLLPLVREVFGAAVNVVELQRERV
ncbi:MULTISPECIES: sensor histidine kinase N-terminal domain-containing protein [unclassified Burkholderia]|uniref:sensor histidine kinase N-terminal domain-containing protein n=1 Tax=unclassified Burkholderia TaxID=2613784 RepID=UPI0014228587|nr:MULTISPECIES: sensor histidine kinase N-terminal domain-containing protein [unclassified Burkholderia]NIE87008.1 hypothetical protein [Burkholderia sp. Tr-860]NIF65925.1 hypothetical protein [Burkholderia sp. Cy-647]